MHMCIQAEGKNDTSKYRYYCCWRRCAWKVIFVNEEVQFQFWLFFIQFGSWNFTFPAILKIGITRRGDIRSDALILVINIIYNKLYNFRLNYFNAYSFCSNFLMLLAQKLKTIFGAPYVYLSIYFIFKKNPKNWCINCFWFHFVFEFCLHKFMSSFESLNLKFIGKLAYIQCTKSAVNFIIFDGF